MTIETLKVRPAPKDRHVLSQQGELLSIPKGWELLKPGDAALTRRVKQKTAHWLVQKQVKGRMQSQGIWAPQFIIQGIQKELEEERSRPEYQKKLDSSRAKRAEKELEYSKEFELQILQFLNFHPRYQLLAREVAKRITLHATPVGSGTVARTQRIPLEKRVEAACIAWLRHQTTGYDNMHIAKIKGKRREVRTQLAKRSKELLNSYRKGAGIDTENCPLQKAIRQG